VCGFDVSEKMVEIARTNHPLCDFKVADATTLEIEENYDLIIAWDSIFHLPLDQHFPVIQKLSSKLNTNGVLLYTFGDAQGEHTDTWHNDEFYYSSMGINRNLMLLMECGLKIVHLVLDQLPNNHVTVMAKRTP
ncbi:class I SAM-dependent methyltransferase, partial [bacterium]|nr:class I SAM-dependent methyltransferase [bacterium]